MKPILHGQQLRIGYGSQTVAGPFDVSLQAGELVGLLGRNGSGKSTLLRTLAGLQDAVGGTIYLGDQPLDELSAQELATHLSVVLTNPPPTGPLSVRELVALGRYPYTGWLGRLSAEDHRHVQQALELTGTERWAKLPVDQLSDGERQKVMIARAVAQDTPLVLLDEPTAHLDLINRVEIMRLLRRLAHETHKAMFLSCHELDLALQTCDRLALLLPDGSLHVDAPEALILNGTFERAFVADAHHIEFDRQRGTFNVRETTGQRIRITGEATTVYWTRKALERIGFQINNEARGIPEVQCDSWLHWTLRNPDGTTEEFAELQKLLSHLQPDRHEKRNT
ncbi:iron complex transport system ATP-binding protein [Catalinimonas alkaloidigena]|uniref:Iron complex transport system ATP-binding protein n=1 Tax=Catalinimonas alkaloidigena TaxID=1075417 RepID=A0A1G8XZG6_9BACT|nr:ABC transporter ATP-binding protein [Catalinimonas alkaloidigena]SDJ95913.1 iron complex transport system ATP-binding protein [Catalinimonas alkaloidigena]